MRLIILMIICSSFLFPVVLNNKFVLTRNSLSSLINSLNIYKYIEKNPKVYKKLEDKSLFSFGDFDSVASKHTSSYDEFYIFDTKDDNHIYIKIPSRLLKHEFDFRQYKKEIGNNKSKYYILRFKKEFTKDGLIYLTLNTGKKKQFVLTFNSKNIAIFLKSHSNLLFEKADIFDSVKTFDDKILFTTNYTKQNFKINFYLKKFIRIQKGKLISRHIEKTFLIKIDENLPPLSCEDDNLLESIYIDDEEFVIGEETFTDNIYSLYLLNYEDAFNKFLKQKIKFISLSSKINKNTHNLSYKYKMREVKISLNLPRRINYDIQNKFISSFNSFGFKINGILFEGYMKGKKVYEIQKNICNESDNSLKVINTKNYSEYEKWSLEINEDKSLISWTPKFNIYKVSPIIYAPFLLKKKNKYIINSMIDEESTMEGEIKYAYIHNNIRYQNKTSINPKTNTNLYFKYPINTSMSNILKKTKFIYNSNPIEVVSNDKEKIKFTANSANKIALVYIPTGNMESFRKYFLRYFECSKEEIQDEEICFNYLADMENGFNTFLNDLRRTKKYIEIAYRKLTFKEQDKKNLLILNQSNRIYHQASDEQVLGKTYDKYIWDLSSSLSFDKKIFENYGLSNIDLIYFSAIDEQNTKVLSSLNDYGFNKVFLVNFGYNMSNGLSQYKNMKLINHKYNKAMDSGMREFDIEILKNIVNQIVDN